MAKLINIDNNNNMTCIICAKVKSGGCFSMAGNLQKNHVTVNKIYHDVIDGKDLREMLFLACERLKEHIDIVNGINVYPVPDSDTGINMYQTFQEIVKAIMDTDKEDFSSVISAAAKGAFRGGTGNSGIILAEYFYGLNNAWNGQEFIDGKLLAEGLASGTETAYLALDNPREGTILTVARVISETALKCTLSNNNPFEILLTIFGEARQALINTYFLLPAAKKAGVVDAGALGLVLMFEGFISAIFGDNVPSGYHSRTIDSDLLPFLVPELGHVGEMEPEWEIQFLIGSLKKPLDFIRAQLSLDGTSLVVQHDNASPSLKVHIHTKDPRNVISKISNLTGVHKVISVEALHQQYKEFIEKLRNKVSE
ncbi:MAG: DAK2 domain-containing protein [Candidatus Odinarchaeota archaeon]